MFRKIAILCFFLIGSGSLHAALIDNGNFTTDTVSEFDWLDLTASQSFSYNELIVETAAGGLFEGYQLATIAEVDTLFDAAGLPASGNDTIDFAAVDALIDLIGATSSQDSFLESFGITATPGIGSGHRVTGLDFFFDSSIPTYALIGGLTYSDTFGPDIAGGWLVRETTVVPLPPALILFGTAIVGLIGFKRRRQTT